jgi:hypothetical protein
MRLREVRYWAEKAKSMGRKVKGSDSMLRYVSDANTASKFKEFLRP